MDPDVKINGFALEKYLPKPLVREISAILSSLPEGGALTEIRLRLWGCSGVVIFGKYFPLHSRLSEEQMRAVVRKICDGAIYAHRDGISGGFVALAGGVRVGISGQAVYEDGRILGVDKVSCLVFRLPVRGCSFALAAFRAWVERGSPNMLICAPPGGGKTTLLRALGTYIGSGAQRKRVVAVDERCEFLAEDYDGASVDLLRGYDRALGVQIAIRTLSAQVILVDEIVAEREACAIIEANGAGVRVIATAHAEDMRGLMRRPCIRRLLDGGMFPLALFIKRERGEYSFRVEEVEGCILSAAR